jgi:hypothetical protein
MQEVGSPKIKQKLMLLFNPVLAETETTAYRR